MEEQIVLLAAAIIIIVLVVLLVRKNAVGRKELQQVEGIVDRYFTELQEETEKLYKAYLEDVNFLQKKVNTLEMQIKQIQQAKQIDIKIDQNSDIPVKVNRGPESPAKINQSPENQPRINQDPEVRAKIDQQSEIPALPLHMQKRAQSAYQQKYKQFAAQDGLDQQDGYLDNRVEMTPNDRQQPESPEQPPENPAKELSVSAQVILLHEQGLSTEEIAKQLNMMCGEVQLMVGLFRRKSEV